jgi:hypothetical protein
MPSPFGKDKSGKIEKPPVMLEHGQRLRAISGA